MYHSSGAPFSSTDIKLPPQTCAQPVSHGRTERRSLTGLAERSQPYDPDSDGSFPKVRHAAMASPQGVAVPSVQSPRSRGNK